MFDNSDLLPPLEIPNISPVVFDVGLPSIPPVERQDLPVIFDDPMPFVQCKEPRTPEFTPSAMSQRQIFDQQAINIDMASPESSSSVLFSRQSSSSSDPIGPQPIFSFAKLCSSSPENTGPSGNMDCELMDSMESMQDSGLEVRNICSWFLEQY